MMSSATAAHRAGRAPKDKNKPAPPAAPKTQQTPKAVAPLETANKTADGVVNKIQPTAEQLRIAQIVNDANKADYPDLKDKVERIIEITGKTSDAALVALHDCDNDSNRAAIMLLEGNDDEGKWETSGKKKKNRQSQQKPPEVNGHDPAPAEKGGEEKESTGEGGNAGRRRGGDSQQKREGFQRYRGPPRMNRGGGQGRNLGSDFPAGRNKENEKNERNLQQSDGGPPRRERNSEGGRTRGPRKNFTSGRDFNGRGRGRGGRSRTFQNRGLQNNDGFPESIDTWQNSTAEKANPTPNTADATMTVGNWSDVAVTEEWSEEDWAENLTETKVFTPSAGTQQSAVTGLDIPASAALGQNIDLTSFLQKSSGENGSASGTVQQQGQSNLMSQQMQQSTVAPQSQSHFDFTQFAKQAADQIKAAVGVVSQPSPAAPTASFQSTTNSTSSYPPPTGYSLNSTTDYSSATSHQQSATSSAQGKGTAAQPPQPLPQRAKPSKARLPPPSKIPESAVVMPDDAVTSLDVSFGALQFGTDPSPFDFGTTAESSNTYQEMSQTTNGSVSQQQQHVSSQPSLPASIPSQQQQSYQSNPPLPPPVTMGKESASAYNLGSHTSHNAVSSDLSQSQRVASQDTSSMLLSQSEHKNVENVSSYVNHRTNQSSSLEGSMLGSKSDQQQSSLNSYGTPSSHDPSSAYSSYGTSQKSVLSSSSTGYTSLNSASADQSASQQQKYQPSQYVSSSASSYGLQQSAYSQSVTTSGNAYPSQTGYSSHTSYGTNNSGYSSQQQSVYSGGSSASTTQGSGSMSSSKLANSLGSHGVKDSSSLMDSSQHSSSQHAYDVASSTASSSNVLSGSSSNLSSQNNSSLGGLGLASTSSSTTTTSVLKNSLSATGKTVPNIPQNMPMLGHQYVMGQATVPFYGLQQPVYSYEDMQMLQQKLSTLGLQSPVYSYEDMQMLQSKLSTLGYYDMQFQAPTSMTGRDPGMGSVAYTSDGKYSSRAETDASTVATTLSQGQASTQAHGQTFLNPALPPGYGYYFTGGMMTGGIHHYAPPIFPVPPATNTHGATTNTQFQKANAYGSHSYNSGYESLTQAQDYSKGTYGAASQNQVKGVSGSGAVPDLSGSVYSKTHAQLAKYNDKPGFHTGTPPPFNLAGTQAPGPLGAQSAYPAQFIPVLAHGQHHSTALLHHHMAQDGQQSTAPTQGQRPGQQQQKASSKQNAYPYWATN